LDLPLASLGVLVASINIQNNINVLKILSKLCLSNRITPFGPIEKRCGGQGSWNCLGCECGKLCLKKRVGVTKPNHR
jgi:hypothetical protein